MFEYYFNKGFIIFDCDENNLERLPYQVKDRFGAEVTTNSEKSCYVIPPSLPLQIH